MARPKKTTGAPKKATKRPTKKKKPSTKVLKDEISFLKQIQEMEKKRYDDLINNRGGPLVGVEIKSFDTKTGFAADKKIDKLLGAGKRKPQERRPSIRMVSRKCCYCGTDVQVSSALTGFNFDPKDERSELPWFSCSNCGGK